MELHQYLSVLARHLRVVVAVIAVAIAVALAFTFLQPTRWSATSTLRVEPSSSLVGGSVQTDDVAYLDRLVNTYSRFATSLEMRHRIAAELGLEAAPAVNFRQIANTNLVEIQVITADRSKATPAAKRLSELLIAQLATLATADAKAAAQAFDRRTRDLEREKARTQRELDDLRADPASARSARALVLRDQISGLSQRLAAIREDHERYESTRDANARGVSLVTEPTVTRPDKPNVKLALALALVLGVVAGAGLAFLMENLSRRFRTGDEIEASVDAPVIASVPVVGGALARSLFNGSSPAEEAFRRLRTTLSLPPRHEADLPDRIILVTSAHAGEGKSTVVANLGRSLAMSGRSTLLVDADLRLPVLHRYFDLRNERGLSDLLRKAPEPGDALDWTPLVRETGVPGLSLMTAGEPVQDPPTLLGRAATTSLFVAFAGRYDYVIADSPAVLAVTDAVELTRTVDGVLLVAGSNVQRDAFRHAHQELTRAGAYIIGVVVNGASEEGLYPYQGYGDYLKGPGRPASAGR